nr:uncharacterized protein LOC117225445 isoform X4 [Megalopta genalis]
MKGERSGFDDRFHPFDPDIVRHIRSHRGRMPCQRWLLIFLIAGTTTLIAGLPDRAMEESMSLTGALNAITRKQRALNTAPQDFYNDLRNMKYRGADADRNRKIGKEHQAEREIDGVDEQIEFLPNDVSQLETVGNDLRTTDLNDKTRKKVLVDYLNGVLQQEEPVTSLFRERERGVSRKRTGGSDRINIDNKQLAKLLLEEEDESPYNVEEEDENRDGNGNRNRDGDEPGRMNTNVLQALYDRYRTNLENYKDYESAGSMPWGDLLNKESLMQDQNAEGDDIEYTDRDVDPKLLYFLLTERKTMNGGYPIGSDYRTYRNMAKRYPVSKRSPQPPKKQATDPKVVQDLGALFGTQSSTNHNHTYDHDHGHDHEHDHDHDHDHDHEHKQQKHESSTEAPKVNLQMKDQKDNATKNDKSKPIEVRKKSIDWSQYFGIDRRRKKSLFMPGQGTQNQDDEWMLQRYYENMGDNLRGNELESKKENFSRKDQLKKTLACILAKYSLEKMDRKANQTSNFRENRNFAKFTDKYKRNDDDDNMIVEDDDNANAEDDDDLMVESKNGNGNGNGEGVVEGDATCLATRDVQEIQERCVFTLASLVGSDLQRLFLEPCVMLELCKACVKDELKKNCLMYYLLDTKRLCNSRPGKRPNMLCPAIAMFFAYYP